MTTRLMVKVWTIITCCMIPLMALKENKIKPVMTETINNVTQLIQGKNALQNNKDQIVKHIDPLFDYTRMSQIALGKHWKSLNADQKSQFQTVFTLTLQNAYLSKFELYTNETITIGQMSKPKSNRIELHSLIKGVDKDYSIIYKFYRSKKTQDWLIYDIKLTGISIMKTYRKKFSEFLRDHTFEDLILKLQEKQTPNQIKDHDHTSVENNTPHTLSTQSNSNKNKN